MAKKKSKKSEKKGLAKKAQAAKDFAKEKLAKKKAPVPRPVKEEDPYLRDVKNTLERKYGTSVELTKKAITIRYQGNDDLNRILEIMDALEK